MLEQFPRCLHSGALSKDASMPGSSCSPAEVPLLLPSMDGMCMVSYQSFHTLTVLSFKAVIIGFL